MTTKRHTPAALAPRRPRRNDGNDVPPLPASYLDTLDQDFWWKTNDGVWLRISEMEIPHLLNTLSWLERRSQEMCMMYGLRLMQQLDRLDAPDDVIDGAVAEDNQAAADPVRWMRNRPLYLGMLSRVLEVLNASIERPVTKPSADVKRGLKVTAVIIDEGSDVRCPHGVAPAAACSICAQINGLYL